MIKIYSRTETEFSACLKFYVEFYAEITIIICIYLSLHSYRTSFNMFDFQPPAESDPPPPQDNDFVDFKKSNITGPCKPSNLYDCRIAHVVTIKLMNSRYEFSAIFKFALIPSPSIFTINVVSRYVVTFTAINIVDSFYHCDFPKRHDLPSSKRFSFQLEL